jgi:uncharacterized protein with PQ loop repeat
MQLFGNITLNISLIIYLIWFVPQIVLNFKRKNTEGLSMLMHGSLCIGYISDLMYGFGREMQWQYRLITIIGLSSLAIQHYQFGCYGLHRPAQKYVYYILNIVYSLLIIYAIVAIKLGYHSKEFYDLAGMLANVCWFTYMLPQIIKNYTAKSTMGLSVSFVALSIFLNLCDNSSAWTLGWDYPSKIGPAITLVGNLILLFQVRYYVRQHQQFRGLAANS